MAVVTAILVMALLGALTMWLPLAARSSPAAARVIALLAAAGQGVPFHHHSWLSRNDATG
jgi:hypothetical protein